jgi:Ca2+-binding EF-hand superfamily protein
MARLALLLGVCVVSVAAGLAAQEPGGRPGGRGGPMPGSPLLMALDANRDGVISAEEIAAATPALKALDKNGDGILWAQEVMPMGRGRGEGPEGGRDGRGGGDGGAGGAPATSADDLVAMLMAYDANKDGQLTKAELPERMQPIFDRADANKDGKLTVDEIRKSAQSSMQAPAASGGRGDGGPGEGPDGRGRGPGGMDLLFRALDANHDGMLQADEIAAAPAALRLLDKNKDGSLTADEYRQAGRIG